MRLSPNIAKIILSKKMLGQNHEIPPPQNPCDCKPVVPPTPPQMGVYVTGQL